MVLHISGRCMGTHVASLGNFAQPVVMGVEQSSDSVFSLETQDPPAVQRVDQQLEHGLC